MSCEQTSESCVESSKCERIEIIQGEKKILTVKILDENNIGKDLTGVSEIWAEFPGTTNWVEKKKSDMVNPIEIVTGTPNVKITLATTDTKKLKVGKNQSFFLAIDFPGSLGRQIFRINNAYDVIELPVTLT